MSPRGALVAVLGASNVTLGLPELSAVTRAYARGPFDLVVAGGHGRSYGLETRVLGRSLPPIRTASLRQDLERLFEPERPTHLAITDVGNDIAYGVPPDEILGWVEESLALAPPGATTSIGLPPLETLSRWSDRGLQLFRLLFFPSSLRFPIGLLRDRLSELDGGLRRLAQRSDVARVVEAPTDWYGWDPIHVRRRHRVDAWCRHLDCPPSRVRRRWPDHQLRLARPSRWRLLGLELGASQPRALADGCRLWLR